MSKVFQKKFDFLNEAKLEPSSSYPQSIKKIKQSPFKNRIIGSNSPLKRIGNYHTLKGDIHQELIWSANLIRYYTNEINDFIATRSTYEDLVLKKDYKSAIEVLAEIEKSHGFSMWIIEAKIALLQLENGLDSQKNYISSLYEKRDSGREFDQVFYLSFLISQRNEPSVKPNSLFTEIQDQLCSDSNMDSFHRDTWIKARYFVLGENITSEEEISTLLAWITSISIYDLYDFLLLAIQNLDKVLNSKSLEVSKKCISKIKDCKINNLLDSNKELIVPKLSLPLSCYNSKLSIELACHSERKLGTNDNSLCYELIDKIRDTFSLSDTRLESLEWVNKTCLNLKHISTIPAYRGITRALDQSNNNPQLENIETNTFKEKVSIATLRELKGKISLGSSELDNIYTDINEIIFKNTKLKISPKGKLRNLQQSSLKIKEILYKKEQIEILISENKIPEAFELSVDSYLKNKNHIDILPIEKLVSEKKWTNYKDIPNIYDVAIIIALHIKKTKNEKQKFNMKACCQLHINNSDIKNHHEFEKKHFNNDQRRLLEFLTNVCIPESLELNTQTYNSPRQILDERIKICEKILAGKINPKIESELKGIKRRITISDGLKTADTRGVTVDLDGFLTIANSKFKDKFERYIAFLDAGIDTNSEYENQHTNNMIYTPNEEGDQIVISILKELSAIFLSHHEYGLDYYLSMRIRHGRFIGILRGPLERRKLITKYSKESNSYEENTFWHDKYEKLLTPDELHALQHELSLFSIKFDRMIKDFVDDYIQIQTTKKTKGMYSIVISEKILVLAKDFIKQSPNFEHFAKEFFDFFLMTIDSCSKEIQKKINEELKEGIRNMTLELIQKTNTIIYPKEIARNNSSLQDELNHLRNDLESSLKTIISWFETSTYEKQDIRFYKFSELTEIGLTRTKQTRPNFSPKLNIKLEQNDEFLYSATIVPIFSDIFSILFDNISDYNDISNHIEASISADVINSKDGEVIVSLHISNESKVTHKKLETIQRIKEEIENKDIRSSQEGNSGYHKISAMSQIKNKKDLDFGFDNDVFFTKIKLNLTVDYLQTNEEEST